MKLCTFNNPERFCACAYEKEGGLFIKMGMKRCFFGLAGILILLTALTACNQASRKPHHEASTPTPIQLKVSFQSNPNHPEANQPTLLSASVQSNTAPVKDAEVELEVWKEGQKHQMLSTKQNKAGVYSTKHTFTQAGTYQVVVHVMTPNIHQMITGVVNVGQS
jgi:hypothetical protein